MFEVTFLGHQGWLIESNRTRLVVDPLFGPGLGNMPEDGFEVFPPRKLDLDAFPPIDAVVVTHEHSDHLSIPSLMRVDRTIPVFLPARSSLAARGILRELGFSPSLLRTGEGARIGDLDVYPFAPGEATRDEWEVMPLLIRDRGGEGSFATSIDAVESASFAQFALERAGRIGAWASTHNHMDLFPVMYGGRQERDEEVIRRLTRSFASQFEKNFGRGPRPDVLLILASGFSYRTDLAWMNRHVFPGAPWKIAPVLAQSLGVHALAPLPGHCFSFSGGALQDEARSRPFLAPLDPHEWPPHAAEPLEGDAPDFEPACGRREFSVDDLAILKEALRSFAGYLYGGALFRNLYALGDADVGGPRGGGVEGTRRRPEVGFVLRTPSATLTLAYRPEGCAFEAMSARDPRAELMAGLECWATDLLAILRFELFSGYMLVGRYRKWNCVSDRLRCDLDADLALYTHPLRHPDRTLELYRKTASALGPVVGPSRIFRSPT
jgi:hypothetical protein